MQAQNQQWQSPYPKTRYRIFFLDDMPFWVRKVRDTLVDAGYSVFTAMSREEALSLLNDTHVHLGIFDVNLAHKEEKPDAREPLNRDGLDLAVEVKFPPVRLIFSVHQNIDWIRDSFYGAHVADYIIKDEEKIAELVPKIEKAIAERLYINYELVMHWKNASLQEMVMRLSPELDLERQVERMLEINDLLRMQFYKEGNLFFEQISLEILPIDKPQSLWLKVQAYTEKGENHQYLLLCGEQAVMGERPHQLEGRVKLRTVGEADCLQTVHYRLELFEVIDGSLRELDTLAQYWRRGDRELVADAVEEICQGRYPRSLRESKNYEEGSLLELALGMDEPVSEESIERLYEIALRISKEWKQLIPDSPFSVGEKLSYELNNTLEFPNPILHLEALSRQIVQRKVGKVQGDLRLETIVARDSDGQLLWIADEGYSASVLRDYVTLERSLHLLEISQIELEDYELLAQVLNDCKNEALVEKLIPDIQDSARLIQQIRRFAISELGCSLEDYLQDLYMDLMHFLMSYPPQNFVGYEMLMQYSHCLFFAGQICRDLLATSVIIPPVRERDGVFIDEELRKIRVLGKSVRLSEKQFGIFHLLYKHIGNICSYTDIIVIGLKEKPLADIEADKPHIHTAISRLRRDITPLGFVIESSKTGYSLKKN